MNDLFCWSNGTVSRLDSVCLSVASMSLHMGIGVFDGLMAYKSNDVFVPFKLEEHLDRFFNGINKMGMSIKYGKKDLKEAIYSLLELYGAHEYCYIRPIAYRSSAHLWLTGIEEVPVDLTIIAIPVSSGMGSSIKLEISNVRRVSSRSIPVSWKISGCYANSFLCRYLANGSGFDDGLMLDQKGRISECSAANIFFVKGDYIFTPSLDCDVFPGITRSSLIDLARSIGYRVEEVSLRQHDIFGMEASFICSTLLEIRYVEEIGRFKMDSRNSIVINNIIEEYSSLLRGGRV